MTVKAITVQHKNVLRYLEETGKYETGKYESGVRTVPTSRSRAYDYMMKTYGYKKPSDISSSCRSKSGVLWSELWRRLCCY